MGSLALLVKVGSAVLVAGTAIAVPVTITLNSGSKTKRNASKSETTKPESYYKENCKVIDTTADNQHKLLYCGEDYYLHSTSNNLKVFKKIESLKVKDPSKKTLVVSEKKGETTGTQELTVKNEAWTKLPKDEELINNQKISCSLSGKNIKDPDPSWTCVKSGTGTDYQTYNPIKLTTFN